MLKGTQEGAAEGDSVTETAVLQELCGLLETKFCDRNCTPPGALWFTGDQTGPSHIPSWYKFYVYVGVLPTYQDSL